MSTFAAVTIFAFTWLVIASRRLRWLPIGRPAGALVGAVAMVAVGALSPHQALAAIDLDTLALLLGMMLLTAYLARAGFFERVTQAALRRLHSPVRLLLAVAWLSAILSAILVNDTVCLFMTPLVVQLCARARLPCGPYLIALATSANIGSAATLVGNPQNMLIGSMSGIGFADFLRWSGLATLAAMLVQSLLLVLFYRRRLTEAVPGGEIRFDHAPGSPALAAPMSNPLLVAATVVAVVIAFLAGAHLGFTALGAATFLMLVERRDPSDVLAEVDGALLLFFAALFVVVAGFETTGLVETAWTASAAGLDLESMGGLAALSGVLTVGSNLVSNVPMVLLSGPWLEALGLGERGWVLLGFVTTVAGNLTLLGSVANIIVAERARPAYDLGFVEYLRFGVASTLAALAVGVPVIMLTV